jgi:hypothetical protein
LLLFLFFIGQKLSQVFLLQIGKGLCGHPFY